MSLRLTIRDDMISPDQRGLYRRAWLLVTLLAPAVCLFGMMRCFRVLRILSDMPGRRRPPADPMPRAKVIGYVAQVATRRSAFEAACLERALATWFLLRREGIESDLLMGTGFTGDGFRAHTWVQVQNQVVSERVDPRLRYAAFGRPISAMIARKDGSRA